MATCKQTIGQSQIQAVFVEIEDTDGVLQKPTASGYVLPAGEATISQQPPTSNSEEKSNSLNVTEQFQDQVPAGDASVAMYIRPAEDYTGKPQGDAILQSLMGVKQSSGTITMSLAEDINATVTEILVDTLAGGFLVPRGVIQVNDEMIRFKNAISNTDGTYRLIECDRGYAGTTAAAHLDMETATVVSTSYLQDKCRPTVSLWIQTDHTVWFMSGCKPSSTDIPLTGTGGQMINVSFQGRKMGWCGNSTIQAISGGVITVQTEESYGYSVGGYIKNETKSLDNGGAGYQIMEVDNENNTITVSPIPSGWAVDDSLAPFLPVGLAVGKPTESRKVRVFVGAVDGVLKSSKQREGSLTINTPTEFANEIGDEFVGESADSMREITLSGGVYFRKEDGKRIGKGYQGFEERTDILLGDKAQQTFAFILPRVKYNTPTVATEGQFFVLNQDGTALGDANIRQGESSLYISIE